MPGWVLTLASQPSRVNSVPRSVSREMAAWALAPVRTFRVIRALVIMVILSGRT
jgi:hypothetical protein